MKNTLKRLITSLAFFGCALGSVSTHAAFIGNDLKVDLLAPNVLTTTTVTVGAGVEVQNLLARTEDIDISDTGILVTNDGAGTNSALSFNGYRFFDVDGLIPDIVNVVISSLSGYAPAANVQVTFDADNIFLNVQGTSFTSDASIELAVDFASVPTPATIALIGFGLAGIGYQRRKKIQAA